MKTQDKERALNLLLSAKRVEEIGPRTTSKRKALKLFKNFIETCSMYTLGLAIGASIFSHTPPLPNIVIDPIKYASSFVLPSEDNLEEINSNKPVIIGNLGSDWDLKIAPNIIKPENQDNLLKSTDTFENIEHRSIHLMSFMLENKHLDPKKAAIFLYVLENAYSTYYLPRNQPDLIKIQQEKISKSKKWISDFFEASKKNDLKSIDNLFENYPDPNSNYYFEELKKSYGWKKITSLVFSSSFSFGSPEDKFVYDSHTDASKLIDDPANSLIQSLDNAGIAMFKVTPFVADKPEILAMFAAKIDKANEEIQQTTGLNGKVLGLNYRVVLDINKINQNGHAWRGDGLVYISAWWDTLTHELYHGMEYTLAESIPGYTKHRLLSGQYKITDDSLLPIMDNFNIRSAQIQLWEDINNPNLNNRQKRAIQAHALSEDYSDRSDITMFSALRRSSYQAITEQVPSGSPWIHWRTHAASSIDGWAVKILFKKGREARYLTSEGEILASSFAGYVDSFKKEIPNGRVLTTINETLVSYVPTPIEAHATRKAWQSYFEKLRPWFIDDTNKRLGNLEPLDFEAWNFKEKVLLDRVSEIETQLNKPGPSS